jgi:hypothetical protein
VHFDLKLLTTDTVIALAKDCRWKLQAILRTRKFNTGVQLVALYKSQLLSSIESRTAAIYHACDSALEALDHVQSKLLEAVGANKVEALLAFQFGTTGGQKGYGVARAHSPYGSGQRTDPL